MSDPARLRQQARAARDALMVTRWLAGESITAIAKDNELSEQRVRQVLQSKPDLAQERERRQHRGQPARRELVNNWSRCNPGAPLQQAVDELGLSRAQIKALLGQRVDLHDKETREAPASERAILAALNEFLQHSRHDTRITTYRRMMQTREWPPPETVLARYGSWRAALRAAQS